MRNDELQGNDTDQTDDTLQTDDTVQREMGTDERRAEMRNDARPDMQETRPDMQRDMPMQRRTATQSEMWPEMTDFHRRFRDLESEFIEDPKGAVRKAEKLMEEMVESLTRSMHDRMHSMHRDVDGQDGDTEMLRQTMAGYRTWLESMGGRQAA